MADSVSIRTAAGGILNLPVTPADIVDRCSPCRQTFREGDWYCAHLAAKHGHQIALMADQGQPAAS